MVCIRERNGIWVTMRIWKGMGIWKGCGSPVPAATAHSPPYGALLPVAHLGKLGEEVMLTPRHALRQIHDDNLWQS